MFITDEELVLTNIFTGKKNYIKVEMVKGFSTSDIHSKVSRFDIIIMYADDSTTYEFPLFMLRNFKELKKSFRIHGIEYLGHEPYALNWYGKRKPKYL